MQVYYGMLCFLAMLSVLAHWFATPVTASEVCQSARTVAEEYNPASCREERNAFLKKFPKVRKNERSYVALCKLYQEFHTCMENHLKSCPAERLNYEKHWGHVHGFMNHACVTKTQAYIDEFACLRSLQRDLLVQRCDYVYTFKKTQDVYDHCELLNEAVACKQRMMVSECGERVGNVVYHVTKIAMLTQSGDYSCQIQKQNRSTGFVFNESCRPGIGDEVYLCYQDYVLDKLKYFEDYQFVTSTNRHHVHKVCRNFKRYNRCVGKIMSSCPVGVALVFELIGKMRTDINKFNHVCGKHGTDYTSNLKCYQDTVNSTSLAACQPIFVKDIIPYLNDMSAHDYYCGEKTGDPAVKKLHMHMNRLKKCYEGIFAKECGKFAGKTIARLLSVMFDDPYYLKFDMQYDDSSLPGDSKKKRHSHASLKCEELRIKTVHQKQELTSIPTSHNPTGSSSVVTDTDQSRKRIEKHHHKHRDQKHKKGHTGHKHVHHDKSLTSITVNDGVSRDDEKAYTHRPHRGQRGHHQPNQQRPERTREDGNSIVFAPSKEEFNHKDSSIKISAHTANSGHKSNINLLSVVVLTVTLQMGLRMR